MKLQLVYAPHPVLTIVAQPVKRVDNKVRQLVHDMETVLASCHDPEGVGLAAPQVGKSLRLFVIRPTPSDPIRAFINPHFVVPPAKPLATRGKTSRDARGTPHANHDHDMLEGCLSVKNVWSPVERSSIVKLSYQDIDGTHHTKRLTGFDAHIIQHEVDHLNGILFTQRALEQGKQLYRVEKEDGKEEFEPIDL